MSEFTVEIVRHGELGALTSAELELPATQAEYHDAMEKARTTDYKSAYSTELLDCKRGWLRPHIPESINLLQLNLLAIRMDKYMRDEMDIFEGMVKIETERNGRKPIPLPRLINLTFSTGNCYIAGGVKNDVGLGRFLFENDMLPEEVRDFAATRIFWGSETENERFGLIGARHRQRENGVFTTSGRYVEFDGSVNEVYIPGEMACFESSGAPVVLEIIGGLFDAPGYGSGLTATLDMPIVSEKILKETLKIVDAAALENCSFRCIDCLIPSAKELIDEADDYFVLGNFAKALNAMKRHTNPALYKAMLEAVKPSDLESASELLAEVDDYTLDTEMSGPDDYAREYLSRLNGGDERIDLSKLVNPYALGEQVMKLENAAWTSYGILRRKDGGPIQSQADQPSIKMEM